MRPSPRSQWPPSSTPRPPPLPRSPSLSPPPPPASPHRMPRHRLPTRCSQLPPLLPPPLTPHPLLPPPSLPPPRPSLPDPTPSPPLILHPLPIDPHRQRAAAQRPPRPLVLFSASRLVRRTTPLTARWRTRRKSSPQSPLSMPPIRMTISSPRRMTTTIRRSHRPPSEPPSPHCHRAHPLGAPRLFAPSSPPPPNPPESPQPVHSRCQLILV